MVAWLLSEKSTDIAVLNLHKNQIGILSRIKIYLSFQWEASFGTWQNSNLILREYKIDKFNGAEDSPWRDRFIVSRDRIEGTEIFQIFQSIE